MLGTDQRKRVEEMEKGKLYFNEQGLPICHICGKAYNRLLTHVRQKHDMSAYGYKEHFGLNTSKSICSEETIAKSRQLVFQNKYVLKNLLVGGISTQFKKGSEGRTRKQLSLQEKLRLQKYACTNVSTASRVKNAKNINLHKLGLETRRANKKEV